MNDKKTSARTLTMLALLVAMSIVFSRVLSISTGFVRFNLGSLPVLLAAVVFGPGAGFAVGAVADIIGGVLAGYAINPLITLGAGAIGLVAGFAWQKLSSLSTNLRLAASVLLGHFVGSMVITSLALRLFYGYPWATLAVRIPNALILSAVNVVLDVYKRQELLSRFELETSSLPRMRSTNCCLLYTSGSWLCAAKTEGVSSQKQKSGRAGGQAARPVFVFFASAVVPNTRCV